jgi:hypothetical protein
MSFVVQSMASLMEAASMLQQHCSLLPLLPHMLAEVGH